MTENFAWPQKGNKAYTSGKEAAYFHVPSTKGYFPPHADAFKSAADIILERCIDDGHKPYNDILFLPVAYLYRHYLELRLKAIVQVGLGMEFFKKADVEKDLHDHNLFRLWNHAKKLLMDRWPDADDAPLKGAESVVLEFHQSDPSGQMFRYESDKNGRPFKQDSLPPAVGDTRPRRRKSITLRHHPRFLHHQRPRTGLQRQTQPTFLTRLRRAVILIQLQNRCLKCNR